MCCTEARPLKLLILQIQISTADSLVLHVPHLWSCPLLLVLVALGMPRKLSCRDPTVNTYTALPGDLSVFYGPKLIKPHNIHGRQISMNHNR